MVAWTEATFPTHCPATCFDTLQEGSFYLFILALWQLETSYKERGNDVTANLYIGISAAAFLALMEIKPSACEKAI